MDLFWVCPIWSLLSFLDVCLLPNFGISTIISSNILLSPYSSNSLSEIPLMQVLNLLFLSYRYLKLCSCFFFQSMFSLLFRQDGFYCSVKFTNPILCHLHYIIESSSNLFFIIIFFISIVYTCFSLTIPISIFHLFQGNSWLIIWNIFMMAALKSCHIIPMSDLSQCWPQLIVFSLSGCYFLVSWYDGWFLTLLWMCIYHIRRLWVLFKFFILVDSHFV